MTNVNYRLMEIDSNYTLKNQDLVDLIENVPLDEVIVEKKIHNDDLFNVIKFLVETFEM